MTEVDSIRPDEAKACGRFDEVRSPTNHLNGIALPACLHARLRACSHGWTLFPLRTPATPICPSPARCGCRVSSSEMPLPEAGWPQRNSGACRKRSTSACLIQSGMPSRVQRRSFRRWGQPRHCAPGPSGGPQRLQTMIGTLSSRGTSQPCSPRLPAVRSSRIHSRTRERIASARRAASPSRGFLYSNGRSARGGVTSSRHLPGNSGENQR